MKKICTRCGAKKDLSEFNTRNNYHGTTTVYYKSHCKACDIRLSNEWKEKNRERYNEYHRQYNIKRGKRNI